MHAWQSWGRGYAVDVVSWSTGGALHVLTLLLVTAACSESSKTQSGNDAGSGGSAGSASTTSGRGGSGTMDGGEAGVSVTGGSTATGGASGAAGGSSGAGGSAAGAPNMGGVAGAAATGGASGAAGSEGTPVECEGAKSLEGDMVVSAGVESEELVRSISGNLTIFATVKELRQLRCLESVGGSLRVTVGSGTDDLEALARLRSVGSDVIIEDTSYTSLAGLRSLSGFPTRLNIEGNHKLVDLVGLEGLTGVSFMVINANPALSNIEALSNMTGEVSDLDITTNDALESLSGLGGISGVTTDLTVSGNASLRDITGLDGIESIDGAAYFRNNPLLSTCDVAEFVARCQPSGGSTNQGNAGCN